MQRHCCTTYRINSIIRVNQNVLAQVSFLGNVNCVLLYVLVCMMDFLNQVMSFGLKVQPQGNENTG